MLLGLEIVLTITAWARGWKWWALLTWPVALIAAFVVSMARGAASGFVADIVLVAGLLILSIAGHRGGRGRKVTQIAATEEAASATAPGSSPAAPSGGDRQGGGR